MSGLPGLPGEDGAPGQKVKQYLTDHFNNGDEKKSYYLLNKPIRSFRVSLVCLV